MDYLRRVTTNPNRYGQYNIKNGKFGGMKWINITVQYMLRVMLRIYIDPRDLGG